MDLKENIFGETIECPCGRAHHIQPDTVLYEDAATEEAPNILCRYTKGRRVAVLMDVRTRYAAGALIVERLRNAGWTVKEVIIPDPEQDKSPVCDDLTKAWLEAEIQQLDLFLPVGSGVLTDLGKWLAFEQGLPFVVFATAASMNGYTSANVAPTIEGVKTLLRARPPVAVLSSPSVLRDAPWELTTAGLGDIIAKSVSSADWYLNHFLFGDYYCEQSVNLIAEIEPYYLERPEDLRARDPESLETLFQGLLFTGVSMTMAQTSAPSSGSEHMVSHALDMMSSIDGVSHDLHGRQVGIGTILTSALYRYILAIDSPKFSEPQSEIDRAFWESHAENLAGQYAQKQDRLHKARAVLSQGRAWDNLRAQISPLLRSPAVVHDCLRRAGAAYRAEDIGCSRERVLSALIHAHEIRSRFTALDLGHLLGILPGKAAEIIEQWV